MQTGTGGGCDRAWVVPVVSVLGGSGAVWLPRSESAARDKAAPQDYTVRPILVGAGGIRMQGGGYALDGSVIRVSRREPELSHRGAAELAAGPRQLPGLGPG